MLRVLTSFWSMSVKRRMLAVAALTCVSLVVTYAYVLPVVTYVTEDVVFARRIAHTADVLAREARAGAADVLPRAPIGTRVWIGLASVPPELRAFLDGLDSGEHEFNDMLLDGKPREVFVAVRDLGARRLFVLDDVTDLEALERQPELVYRVLIAAGVAIALVALVLSILVTLHVLRGLAALEALVTTPSPRDEPRALARRVSQSAEAFAEDEFGRVARRWAAAQESVLLAVERERSFTRDASHELRTPLTAMRGAIELLEQKIDPAREQASSRILERLRLAATDMERLIYAFLWLARARVEDEAHPRVELAPIVKRLAEDIIEQHAARRDSIELVETATLSMVAPRAVVEIVMQNLLLNAWRHAAELGALGASGNAGGAAETGIGEAGFGEAGFGEEAAAADSGRCASEARVRVELGADFVRISNAVSDTEARDRVLGEESFGFGLTIVRDLCTRFGWALEFGVVGESSFVARIDVVRPLTEA